MALTTIFCHFKVSLDTETDRHNPTLFDTYSTTTLSLVGYKIEGNAFVPRVRLSPSNVPSLSDPPFNPLHSSTPPSSSTLLSTSTTPPGSTPHPTISSAAPVTNTFE